MYSTGTGNLNRGHSRLPFCQKDSVCLCATELGTHTACGGSGGSVGGRRVATPAESHGAFEDGCGQPSPLETRIGGSVGTVAEEAVGNQGLRRHGMKTTSRNTPKNRKYNKTSLGAEPLKSSSIVLTLVWKNGADPPRTLPQNDGRPPAFRYD